MQLPFFSVGNFCEPINPCSACTISSTIGCARACRCRIATAHLLVVQGARAGHEPSQQILADHMNPRAKNVLCAPSIVPFTHVQVQAKELLQQQ